MKLIEKDGGVAIELVMLMRTQGMTVSSFVTALDLNDLLQKEWVKAKEGTFRAQLGGRFPTEEEMVLLRKLGADAIPIDFGINDWGTLFLGATMKAVTRRAWFLLMEEDRTALSIPHPVYLLGSGRAVNPDQEMPTNIPEILQETGAVFNHLCDHDAQMGQWPHTEMEVIEKVLDWTNSPWKTRSVCASDVAKPGGGTRAANTAETVKEWLTVASPGRYLIVSSQPFCENQRMAVERAVKEAGKEGYTFDVCGPEAPPLPLSRWLDNLAKQLWEEVQLLPK